MQTALVIRTRKVLATQPHNRPVIPPQEEGHDDIKRPGTGHLAPDSTGAHIQGSHDGKGRKPLHLGSFALRHVHGDHDRAAENTHEQEDIATHLGEPQEHRGVQPDAAHQLRLLGVQHGLEPGEESPAHGRWRVFVVCMLDLGSIDDRVTRTNEREEETKQDGDSDGRC